MDCCLTGKLADPHHFLGLHRLDDGDRWVIRAIDSHALSLSLIVPNSELKVTLKKISPDGFFEGEFKSSSSIDSYFFVSEYPEGSHKWIDPYSFLPSLSNQDLADFNNGIERRPFLKLGSFPSTYKGVDGVAFVVWAPSAQSIHLVGDFNHWNKVNLPMRSLGSSGCRELFVPGAKIGDKYKYRVLGADDVLREKTDPFALRFEAPTGNASIVQARDSFSTSFGSSGIPPVEKPVSVYEMHLGSWKHDKNGKPLSYLELSKKPAKIPPVR